MNGSKFRAYEFGVTAANDAGNLWIYDFQASLLYPTRETRRAYNLGKTRSVRGVR